MTRFCILIHDWPSLHYDLMLEVNGVLKTWRLAGEPGNGPVGAEPIGDHRLDYLDYEGPVSGGRGTVKRWDRGELSDFKKQNAGWSFKLAGARVQGEFDIVKKNEKWIFV